MGEDNRVTTDAVDVVKEVEEMVKTKLVKVVNCARVHVRKGPSKRFESIYTVKAGRELLVEDFKKGEQWAKVHNSAGVEGYVMSEFLGD